ncbi:unnamed protein product [marine sediment metagenome]|uniref:Uncharacterized protein n=1 Tax=marine sediment metagenome TaxID=412755 RepID=X1AQ41_9ZZZZ
MVATLAMPAYDYPTQCMSGFLLRYIAPRTEPVHLWGLMDTERNFTRALYSSDVIIGCGHGDPDLFTGQYQEVLLDARNLPNMTGKVAFLISCETAQALGKALIDAGCEAFFTVGGEAPPDHDPPPGIEPGEVTGGERAVARYPDADYESIPVGAPTQEVTGPEIKVARYPDAGYENIPVGEEGEEVTGPEIKVDRYPASGYEPVPVGGVSPSEYIQITNVGSVSEANYGQTVYVWVTLENLWDDRLTASAIILVDGHIIEEKQSSVGPGVWSWPRMEFTMPNRTVTLMVIAKYWSGSVWVEADRETKEIILV